MKTALLFIPSIFLFISLSGNDNARRIEKTNTIQPDIPSVSEIGSGLKEALSQGTAKSADQLSAVNGYFGNAAVKILFPPQAQKAEKTLRGLGLIEQPIQFMFTISGVVVALVHVTLPVMVIMLAAGLSHIDRDYQRAAESLGAGPIRTFLTVTLPLSMPGVIAGVTTAFAWTFSAFATPQMIGGGRVNMVSNLVYQLGFASFNFPFAASLSVAGLALTFAVLALVRAAARPLEEIGPY